MTKSSGKSVPKSRSSTTEPEKLTSQAVYKDIKGILDAAPLPETVMVWINGKVVEVDTREIL